MYTELGTVGLMRGGGGAKRLLTVWLVSNDPLNPNPKNLLNRGFRPRVHANFGKVSRNKGGGGGGGGWSSTLSGGSCNKDCLTLVG